MDNKFELVFNERDDAAELKNLPIDDTMHGIIEEEELEDEVSDEEDDVETLPRDERSRISITALSTDHRRLVSSYASKPIILYHAS